jgi:hypothetical protein
LHLNLYIDPNFFGLQPVVFGLQPITFPACHDEQLVKMVWGVLQVLCQEIRSMYTRDPTAKVLEHCNAGRHRTPPLVAATAKAFGSTWSTNQIFNEICLLRDPHCDGYHEDCKWALVHPFCFSFMQFWLSAMATFRKLHLGFQPFFNSFSAFIRYVYLLHHLGTVMYDEYCLWFTYNNQDNKPPQKDDERDRKLANTHRWVSEVEANFWS